MDNEKTGNRVKEKILEWETRIKSYKGARRNKHKKVNRNPVKADEKIRDPKEFIEGDFVLLRDNNAKEPPDKPSPWWYGPFTIRSLR